MFTIFDMSLIYRLSTKKELFPSPSNAPDQIDVSSTPVIGIIVNNCQDLKMKSKCSKKVKSAIFKIDRKIHVSIQYIAKV